MVPEPDHTGTADDAPAGTCDGAPTDAGCRCTAGSSQAAGAVSTLGSAAGCADDATGYVTIGSTASGSAALATGRAAAFAIAGSCRLPEPCDTPKAAAMNTAAAATPQACARDVVRARLAWRA